jgi:hypothetical protein
MASVKATRAQALVQGPARLANVSSLEMVLVDEPGIDSAAGGELGSWRLALGGASAVAREGMAREFTGSPP